MATEPSFIEYIADQAQLEDRLTWKRMFGEYGMYLDGKIVALVCDGSLFVKPAAATAERTAGLPRRPPYPGAKPYPVGDELLDEPERLRALLLATAEALPEPKVAPPRQREKR